MAKGFASTADLAEKKITFSEIGTDLYAFTAEGDPNSAVIVGDDGCMVFDAQATPAMANKVIERVRTVTDKPIKYVVLSHYHAVRVLGASAYHAQAIIASEETRRLVAERGPFCFGPAPTIADICLVPQLYNARRFKVDVSKFRRLLEAEAACLALPAFKDAAPEQQPDFEP